jgi:HlyD family secretion protein
MTVREKIVDAAGKVVPTETPAPGATPAAKKPGALEELKPGQTRKELEGVFLAANGHAVFTPVKTGIAGEKYFEVLDGLKDGDEVITGPFQSVRGIKDGDVVKATAGPAVTPAAGKS